MEKISDTVMEFKRKIISGQPKSNIERYHGTKYDVFEIANEKILIYKVVNPEDSIVQIVLSEDYFSELWKWIKVLGLVVETISLVY